MYKKSSLLLIIFFAVSISALYAQTNTDFYSTTRNNAWTVTKYLYTVNQTDLKSSFSNIDFLFNQKDSMRFLIEVAGGNNTTGRWVKQGSNVILLSLPAAIDSLGNYLSTSYNETVKLLSKPLQIVDVQASLIKLRIVDPMRGEALIEFSKK